MKTRRYCYRLKGLEQVIGFRLEVNSEPHVLFNDLLNKNKGKKKTITVSIEQVIKLAKERMNKQRTQNTTFINLIKYEVGESGQKIFNRIFKLALQRYAQLQHEGKRPILISHRIPQEVKPTPRPAPAPRPRPRPEPQPIQTEQPISHVEKVKALIPKDLHDHVKIEYNPKAKTIVINIIQYLQHEKFMEIGKISKRYHGTYNKEQRRFIIPIEYLP